MKNSLKLALLALFLTIFPVSAQHSHAHHETQTQVLQEIFSKGVIENIDLENKKITITHEAIEALSWPAMTMRFTFESEDLIKNLKSKDNIEFSFIQQGRISLLKSIKKI
jgi:Cu(I)/Ag(I) efflux system protein CusF